MMRDRLNERFRLLVHVHLHFGHLLVFLPVVHFWHLLGLTSLLLLRARHLHSRHLWTLLLLVVR